MSHTKELTHNDIPAFQNTIYENYNRNPRILPWRDTRNPYCILVSEIMLQQTQVDRVIPKYEQFKKTFPDFSVLAQTSLHDVLKVWQGLGYNRRALSLRETAKKVITEYDGILPSETALLL